jgi:anti-sigma B factor antagonist
LNDRDAGNQPDGDKVLRPGGRPAVHQRKKVFNRRQQSNRNPDINADMPLEIQIQKSAGTPDPGAVTLKLAGSLDTATAPDLARQLAPVLTGTARDIVFDLAQLKFVSSAGLRVFSNARKTLHERGGQVSFVNLQPQIQEVFEIIRSLKGVETFTSEAELDQYLAARQQSHAHP